MTMDDILPDILDRGLDVVFCGTAVGPKSAEQRSYYAGPGNKFWQILADIGLTPHRLRPSQFKDVNAHGIGLTDLAKKGTFRYTGARPRIAEGSFGEIAGSIELPLFRATSTIRQRC